MNKRIVVALGGNALGANLKEQKIAVEYTAKVIVDLIEEGYQVVITHGNGPQIGMIHTAMSEFTDVHPEYTPTPMSICVGMTQGYIGYDLQNAIRTELLDRGIKKLVSSIVTQVRVDPTDPAFQNPTKPIGRFMTWEEAEAEEKRNNKCMEDAGRGYRRVVASPQPQEIIEIGIVEALLEAGQVVIACGGGGIPVVADGNRLNGAGAIVDKDFVSALLAKELDATALIILTAVEKVALNFGKHNQEWLSNLTVEEAREYAGKGHFAVGSMLPKVEAGMQFANSAKGRYTLITLLNKAKDGLAGKTGTIIRQE